MSLTLHHLLIYVNAAACAVVALRLFLFRLSYQPKNIIQGIFIYLFIISYSDVTIRTLTGNYTYSGLSEVIINLLLCVISCLRKERLFSELSIKNNVVTGKN
ncbi:phage holin family protein [Erwinia persicina]|uniref:Phage holin family protein n=1 Tax=Erwinia persicina TaxID=55211 RepID=A0A4U3EUW5_9GAMM|nr:phage holin family protein [Erwinia persicina]MBD8170116.1 phage holin family protein [Erwinia persicina]MBD8212230.1 phage holin family protein [Erwinia persicina]TKJ83626.1 phage holin family protein [Erwinia persicina]